MMRHATTVSRASLINRLRGAAGDRSRGDAVPPQVRVVLQVPWIDVISATSASRASTAWRVHRVPVDRRAGRPARHLRSHLDLFVVFSWKHCFDVEINLRNYKHSRNKNTMSMISQHSIEAQQSTGDKQERGAHVPQFGARLSRMRAERYLCTCTREVYRRLIPPPSSCAAPICLSLEAPRLVMLCTCFSFRSLGISVAFSSADVDDGWEIDLGTAGFLESFSFWVWEIEI